MTLIIYSRAGCHLCEQMKAVVEPVARAAGAQVDEIDVSDDPLLEARYGQDVPVLMVDGRRIAKYRVTADEVRRAIDARAGRAATS